MGVGIVGVFVGGGGSQGLVAFLQAVPEPLPMELVKLEKLKPS